jgi:hypothetical protein
VARWLKSALVGLSVAAVIVVALVLLLRDSDDTNTKKAPSASAVRSAVTRASGERVLPSACDPARVATDVMRFFGAVNHGGARGMRYIAPEPEFRFFSVRNVPGRGRSERRDELT